MKVSRICACGAIVKGKCAACVKKRQVTQDQFRGSPAERGYDHQWKKLSLRFRKHNPLCQRCNMKGRVTIGEDVHHIKPIHSHPELRLVWDNLMTVCRECHREIERENNGS